ncbi:MAG: hypothetical protein PUP46_08990 [Endozoicomonas sp. (ex Botrylloides leachii)]|nr:hypothetical protein [Endozoicomonas sp. (ex Botrylloides leachii)]
METKRVLKAILNVFSVVPLFVVGLMAMGLAPLTVAEENISSPVPTIDEQNDHDEAKDLDYKLKLSTTNDEKQTVEESGDEEYSIQLSANNDSDDMHSDEDEKSTAS